MTRLREPQNVHELGMSTQRIEPWVTRERRQAEEAFLDNPSEDSPRERRFSQICELPRHVEQAFRIG